MNAGKRRTRTTRSLNKKEGLRCFVGRGRGEEGKEAKAPGDGRTGNVEFFRGGERCVQGLRIPGIHTYMGYAGLDKFRVCGVIEGVFSCKLYCGSLSVP